MDKKSIKYILVFFSYFLYEIYLYIFLKLLNIDINEFNDFNKNIALFTIDIIYLVLLYIFMKKELKKDRKKFDKRNIIKYLPIYILGILLMGISNSIITNITGVAISDNEEKIRSMIKVFPIYMFFSSVINAPFVEEIIFRKCTDIFKDKRLYIIISGTLFGLIHVASSSTSVNDLLMGIPYIIMGIDFAYIYVKSNNIFTTMALHSMHNCILIIIQYLGG